MTVHVVPVGIDVAVLSYTGPVWNGDTVTIPEMTFIYDDYELIPGTDYSIASAESTEEESHQVTVTGLGLFSGTRTEAFNVYEKPVASVSCNNLSLMVGQKVKPVVQMLFNDNVPADIQDECVQKMKSNDEAIIEVLEDGTLIAKTAGSTVLTLTSSIPMKEDVQIGVIVEEKGNWKTLMLPDFLKEIGEDAFFGTAADRIVTGSQLKTIQSNAFRSMNNLKQVELRSRSITQDSLNALKQIDAIMLIPANMVQLQTLFEANSISYVLIGE